jgi:hypothetical protein
MWELTQKQTLRVRVLGFPGNIFSLACANGRVFAGLQDTTIRVRSHASLLLFVQHSQLYPTFVHDASHAQSIHVDKLLEHLTNGGPLKQEDTWTVTLDQLAGFEGVLATASEHRGYVYTLATTPRYLISGSGDGLVKVGHSPLSGCCSLLHIFLLSAGMGSRDSPMHSYAVWTLW